MEMTEEVKRFVTERLSWMRNRQERLRSFGEHAVGVVAKTALGVFVVNPEDGGVSAELLVNGVYEPDVHAAVAPFVTIYGAVLVVGAHVGAHAVPLSRCCKRLIAVEANPLTSAYLRTNVLINGCCNVEVIEVAASDKREKLEFLLNRDNSGGSKRMPLRLLLNDIYDEPDVVEVEAAPLDELIRDRSFDLVLMDVEGSEVPALRGMQAILAGTQTLCVEFVAEHLRCVAGVDSDALVDAVVPHFSSMRVLGSDTILAVADAREELRLMAAESNRPADMLFFQKG